jgi:hypothetical protein
MYNHVSFKKETINLTTEVYACQQCMCSLSSIIKNSDYSSIPSN